MKKIRTVKSENGQMTFCLQDFIDTFSESAELTDSESELLKSSMADYFSVHWTHQVILGKDSVFLSVNAFSWLLTHSVGDDVFKKLNNNEILRYKLWMIENYHSLNFSRSEEFERLKVVSTDYPSQLMKLDKIQSSIDQLLKVPDAKPMSREQILAIYLREQGFTMQAIANKVKKNKSTISRWLSNKKSKKSIKTILI